MVRGILLAALILGSACSKEESGQYQKVELRPSAPATAPPQGQSPPAHGGIEWIEVGEVSNVAERVRAELTRAQREKKRLIVYVGALWCEPCERFLKASKTEDFGQEFASVRFLKFDLDKHASALGRAGYDSQYIPLFVLPNKDGRASEKRSVGSKQGQAAVAYLKERVLSLLKTP